MHSRTHSPAVFRNMPLLYISPSLSLSSASILLSPPVPDFRSSRPPLSAIVSVPRESRNCSVIIQHGFNNRWCVHLENISFRGIIPPSSSNVRRDPTTAANANREIGEYRVVDMCAGSVPVPVANSDRTDLDSRAPFYISTRPSSPREFSLRALENAADRSSVQNSA